MNNKIARKYEPLIFVLLVVAYLLRYSYSIYSDFSSIESGSPTTYALTFFYALFEEGILPALIAFFIPSIFYSVGARRGVRFMARTDFVAFSMIITAIVEATLGIFSIFSIIVDGMIGYLSYFEPTLIALAFLLFYFLYVDKKFNLSPIQKANSFKIWFLCLIVWQGIEVVLGEGLMLFLSARTNLLVQLGTEYAYYFALTDLEKILSIVEISMYVVFVVVYIILNYSLRAKCDGYQEPYQEIRTEYSFRPEDNIFEEQKNEKNDDDHHDDINDIFGI